MADLLTTLYDLITSDWALADTDRDTIGNKQADSSKDIHCTTGWYDESFVAPQITITPVSGVEPVKAVGYATVEESEMVDIGVWVQVLKETSKGAGYAKAYVYALREEVKRIIRKNKTATGIYDLDVVDWRFVPEPEREKPVLHYIVTVKALSSAAAPS